MTKKPAIPPDSSAPFPGAERPVSMVHPAPRPRGRNATISDVAERANVSLMTVSRVVNGSPKVREATRESVLAAIRELNYAPNLAARSLAKAEQIRIAVLYGKQTSAYLSEFLVGALDEAAGANAQLLLVKWNEGSAETEQASLDRLLESAPTGVVLPPPFSERGVICDGVREAGIASVSVSSGRPRDGLSCVRVNGRQAAFEMTKRLLDLGHRRIGFIEGPPDQSASTERLAGFQAALVEADDARATVVEGDFSFGSGLAAAEKLLDAADKPTAIFASNDDMAAAVITVAHRRGINLPDELTVVGFDDTPVATTLWPALTTVRQPISEMAAAAIRLLLVEIRSGEKDVAEATDLIMPYTLVERQSAAPPH